MASLIDQLTESQETIDELRNIIDTLAEKGLMHGTVLNVGQTVTVSLKDFVTEVSKPTFPIKRGDAVLTVATGQILKKFTESLPIGEIVAVKQVVEGGFLEVTVHGATERVVLSSHIDSIEEGDFVVLDASKKCAVAKITASKVSQNTELVDAVTWDDIGGQEQAKRELIEAVELPYKHPKTFAFYGKKQTKGILLYGDPGCGKTMMGKAVANSLARKDQQAGFIYVKGPDVLDPYVGVSEANVRSLFSRGRAHKKKFGVPAVIFVDEAESLLGVRGGHNAFMEKTIVPTFLAEMDGIEKSDAIVILATNRPDLIDSAIVRDGRIDRKVKVCRPTQSDAEIICSIHLKKLPLAEGLTVDEAAKYCMNALFCPTKTLYHAVFDDKIPLEINLSHFVSGAMIAGIVDKAVSLAIQRDLEVETPSGISLENLVEAVNQTLVQHQDLNHNEVIDGLANGRKVTFLRKIKHVTETI